MRATVEGFYGQGEVTSVQAICDSNVLWENQVSYK